MTLILKPCQCGRAVPLEHHHHHPMLRSVTSFVLDPLNVALPSSLPFSLAYTPSAGSLLMVVLLGLLTTLLVAFKISGVTSMSWTATFIPMFVVYGLLPIVSCLASTLISALTGVCRPRSRYSE